MTIIVVSDTHGDFHSLSQALNAQPQAELIIHCGDGNEQYKYLKENVTDKQVVGVCGNCDWTSKLPGREIVEVCGKRIFVTHGHLYNAKFTTERMEYAAREENADILLFGHTHQATTDYHDGLYMMNPGSCCGYTASYGYIDITESGGIVTNIVRLNGR